MKKTILILAILFCPMFSLSVASPVYAADASASVCQGIGQYNPDTGDCVNDQGVKNLIGTVVSILSYIVGAVAIIMILIGSLKYVTSAGNDTNIKSAKNTIMYALIGIAIAVLAQVLVRFVITKATSAPPPEVVPVECVPSPTHSCAE